MKTRFFCQRCKKVFTPDAPCRCIRPYTRAVVAREDRRRLRWALAAFAAAAVIAAGIGGAVMILTWPERPVVTRDGAVARVVSFHEIEANDPTPALLPWLRKPGRGSVMYVEATIKGERHWYLVFTTVQGASPTWDRHASVFEVAPPWPDQATLDKWQQRGVR